MSKKSLQSSRRKSETGQNSKIEIADLHLSNFELYRHRGDIGKSFAELSLALCILPSLKEIYYTSYLEVFESWITSVEEKYGFERSMTLFEVALKHYPNSSDLKYLLAKILYRHGSLYEAWSYACLAHSGCSEDPNAQETRDHLTNALIDRWHLPMLNDVHRNMSFKNVIDEAVKNDHDCVLDIGSGTSLLSIYAKWAGAREVYGCEINKFMCEISKDVLASNGSTSGVKIFNLHSQELVVQKHIPKRVSLVVSETVDAGLFGEHILLTLQHAWNHLLLPPHSAETSPINASDNPFEPCGSQVHSLEKQDKRQSCSTEDSKSAEAGIGTEERGQVIDLDVSESMNSLVSKKMHGLVIPSRAEVFVALVSCEYIAKYTKLIHSDIPLFLNKNVSLKLEEPYLSEKLNQVPGGIKLLSDWIPLTKVNFNCPDDINRHLSGALNKTLEIKCTNDGILDAIVVAFNLYTDDKNCISTFPEAQSVAWENAIYPSPTRNTYHVGDVLKIGFECNGVIKLNFESPIGNETINDTETLHLPTDALTFLNSKKFVSYFTHAAAMITEHLMSRSKGDLSCSLVICDTTPFPIAGVSLMRKFTNSQLFVEKRSVLIALKALGIHAMLSEDLENEIDVLFIWPVTKEGTLRDGILKKILMYRLMMAGDGLVFPKELDLIMDAVQSSSLCNMTRVSNANTCGVRVENVINMAKTNHHVDVPLEIVPYDSVLAHPIPILRWSLVSGEVTSLCSHSSVAKSNLLVLGSDVDIVLAKVVAQRSATIHALPYWFLLRGDVIVDHLDIDVRYPGIPASSDASSRRSFEVSTRDLDSPCNQSLLMLEKFYSVTYGKPFCIKTTWRDGIFSAIVQNAEL